MYVNVKGVDLGAFRYIFGIHMLHNIYPRCRIPCGILYLQFFYTLFLAHIFFIFFFCFITLNFNLLILRIRCLQTSKIIIKKPQTLMYNLFLANLPDLQNNLRVALLFFFFLWK